MSWQYKNLPMSRCNLLLLAIAAALTSAADTVAQQPTAKDAFGDPLPEGAVSRLGSIRWRHAGQVTFAAFLPDGKTVISAGADKTIRVWEYPSGKELRRIGPPEPAKVALPINRFAFATRFPVALSKDGKTLAACFDVANPTIRVFDVASGKELQKLMAGAGTPASPDRRILSVAFSPDGTRLSALSLNGSGRVWDWAKDKELSTFGAPSPNGFFDAGIAWSPDGKALAMIKQDNESDDDTLEIWNLTTGKKVQTVKLDAEDGFVFGLVYSPDSKILAMHTNTGQITLMEVAAGKKTRTWTSAPGTALLAFSRDGSKLYGRDAARRNPPTDTVVEWDVADGKLLRKIAVAIFAPDLGRSQIPSFPAAWSPDGKILVMAGDGNAPQLVDVAAGKEIGPGAATLTAVQFTPDGKQVWSRNSTGAIEKWEAGTGERLEVPALAKHLVHGSSSPDGKLLVASSAKESKECAFLDAGTGKALGSLPVSLKVSRVALFSPNSKMLAVRQVQDKKIALYEAPTGKLLHTFAINLVVRGSAGGGKVISLAPAVTFFSSDSKSLAAFADSNTLAVWNTATGERVAEFAPANPIQVHSGAFLRDGRCVVLDFKDGTAVLYELASGRVRRTYGKGPLGKNPLRIPGSAFTMVPEPRVAVAQDGHTLFHAGLDRAIHAWDVDSGKELAVFKGHLDSIDAIALSADGKTLASASADTTALLWDLSRVKRPAPAVKALTQSERDVRWQTLLDHDAAKAFAAICDLSDSPKEAIELLKEKVKPATPVDMKRVEQLVAALQSTEFNTRENAKADLIKMGERVVPAIDRALAADPPLENKRRLEEVRQQTGGIVLQGERLRLYRAVEILERVGTPEARRLLQTLADGRRGALVTTTAQATLLRLEQKN